MKLQNKGWLIWMALAYGLCLVPSGIFDWIKGILQRGADGHSARLSTDPFEWAAHAVLLGGVAYCLARMFRQSCGRLSSLARAMLLVLMIALSIEWLQGLLPESFSRGFSWSDIWSSLLGGLLGASFALTIGTATTKSTEDAKNQH